MWCQAGLLPVTASSADSCLSGTFGRLGKMKWRLLSKDLGGIVIAYEPVWAIGTGLSATRKDIEEMHATVREVINRNDTVVLYGGSVSPESADDVFNAEGVSGALVGGASLNVDKFAAIVAAWERK